MWHPHLTWMDTAMHDMGSTGHTLQIGLPRDWANLALDWDVWRGVVSRCCGASSVEFYIQVFAVAVGGLGLEFCMFVIGLRLAFRSEWWPFVIIIYAT